VNSESVSKAVNILYESLKACIQHLTVMYDDLEATLQELNQGKEIAPTLFSEAGLQALMDLEQEEGYTDLLQGFNESYKQMFAREFTQLDYDYDLIPETEVQLRKLHLSRGCYKYLRVTAKSVLGFIEKMRAEQALINTHRLGQRSQPEPILKSLDEIYLFEGGRLVLKDPELNLSVEESFQPDPHGCGKTILSNGYSPS
jgi:hypothetical protein